MKIGVLSDTHLKEPDPEFKRIVESHFRDVESILHAGDIVDQKVIDYLLGLKELIIVSGNMDPFDIKRAFPYKRVIELGGFRIGLIHGEGSPFGIESRVSKEFDDVDAIVYGHTHTPANHHVRDILFFNPGSLTRSFINRPTLGILDISEKIEGKIIKI